MNILVIGGGGREHALVWKLRQSAHNPRIYCAPGNPGIEERATAVPLRVEDLQGLRQFALDTHIDLTIVGPEVPLVAGIVDFFQAEGLRILGPKKEAAQLEGSKTFAKAFMERHGIPTAQYAKASSFEEAVELLSRFSFPCVIKADGLAAGKGVLIAEDEKQAKSFLEEVFLQGVFGVAGQTVLLEEHLKGIETSVLCFVDGKTLVPMVSSQDHKRIFEGDQGPNTGGMGTYSPNRVYTQEMEKKVTDHILLPTLKGMQEEGMDYRGILFVGLMMTSSGPKVLEYNVRLGDPETQVVLPRLETDLLDILFHVLDQDLASIPITWKENHAVCVVLASGGYPGRYLKHQEVLGLKAVDPDVLVFHAGTSRIEGKVVTSGGRVLGVTAVGESLEEARHKAYSNAERIHFTGKTYRKDIATF